MTTGQGQGSVSLGNDHIAWPRICWSPSGKKLAVGYTNTLRILDIATGEWEKVLNPASGIVSSNGLDWPDEDYVLLNKSVLIHLPSQILVCQYTNANSINAIGGKTFIALMDEAAGIVVPAKMPHPAAKTMLEKSEKDPSVFLLRPGVEVSINAGSTGQHQEQTRKDLETAAEKAGYKVVANSPISIQASITGPTREAVSYIGRGSYTIDKYTSTIKIVHEGKDIWSTSGTNIQGFLVTKPNQSFEDAVQESGRSPNLSVFKNASFPKMLQKPISTPNGQSIPALMTSKFTMQGLVDQ